MDNFSKNYKYIRNLTELSNKKILQFISEDCLISDAVSGAGNDHIFHSTLESLNKLNNIGINPDLVIIQWSGPSRRVHLLPDGFSRFFVNPTENLQYHLKFEPMASTHSLHYMYTLQELLKSKKIRYRFFNYISLDDTIKRLTTYHQIDFSNFINFEKGKEIIFNGLVDLIIQNNLNNDIQGHANPKGNEFISNIILENLNDKI